MLYYLARLSFKMNKPCAYMCACVRARSPCAYYHVMKACGGVEVSGQL